MKKFKVKDLRKREARDKTEKDGTLHGGWKILDGQSNEIKKARNEEVLG